MEEYNKLINENNNIDIDYIKYQLDEIETIDIKENEIEEIEVELNRISKFDKISSSINNIIELFDKNEGISDLLYSFKKNYLQISDDPLFSEYETEVICNADADVHSAGRVGHTTPATPKERSRKIRAEPGKDKIGRNKLCLHLGQYVQATFYQNRP
jgi:DNA repair ATPase RecN